ncbi:hypothetical protein JW707_03485 [Candidatus Woesearchaeota archaeon]|nr:hypothetical protein [Candidatus Woesearchaeota archaeon]
MKEEVIQFIGVKDLSDEEQATVNMLSTEYYGKIKRSLKNLTSLAVQVKTYQKEGAKKKYSVNVRVIAPTHIIEADKASDWDLARTMHKAFKNIEHEIEHKLKVSSQKPRGYE